MAGDIDSFYREYYRQTFRKHGASAKGVDWKDEAAQRLSFEYLLKAIKYHIPENKNIAILELGCGYGSFFSYLKDTGMYPHYDYYGIDLVPEMVEKAQSSFPEIPDHFVAGDFKHYQSKIEYDFIVGSGVFNIRGDFSEAIYEMYVFETISLMFQRASTGIAFNLMTPAPTFRDAKLFYPDINRLFEFIHNNLSRNFVVISSHPLWKVTIGIYK